MKSKGAALENAFNRVGLHYAHCKGRFDGAGHVLWAVMGEQILVAHLPCWIDGQSLRTYLHAPNVGPRKSWAAGDATSRAVVGTSPQWRARRAECSLADPLGISRCSSFRRFVRAARSFRSYVIKNVLFKIAFPAEFHAQPEAVIPLHRLVANVERTSAESTTPKSRRSASSTNPGPSKNPADRDHCLHRGRASSLWQLNRGPRPRPRRSRSASIAFEHS